MFSARRATLVATLLLVAGAPVLPVSAQGDSGVRVRITTGAPSGQRKVGTLVSADADTLRFTSSGSGAVQSIPTASVVRFERSRGRRSNAGRGAVIGGIVGGGLGLLLGIAASADDGGWLTPGPGDVAVVTLFMGGVGAGFGALLGAASKRDRWESVPLPGID